MYDKSPVPGALRTGDSKGKLLLRTGARVEPPVPGAAYRTTAMLRTGGIDRFYPELFTLGSTMNDRYLFLLPSTILCWDELHLLTNI